MGLLLRSLLMVLGVLPAVHCCLAFQLVPLNLYSFPWRTSISFCKWSANKPSDMDNLKMKGLSPDLSARKAVNPAANELIMRGTLYDGTCLQAFTQSTHAHNHTTLFLFQNTQSLPRRKHTLIRTKTTGLQCCCGLISS